MRISIVVFTQHVVAKDDGSWLLLLSAPAFTFTLTFAVEVM